MCPCTAAGVMEIQVARIRMYGKDHDTDMVCNSVVGVGGDVVEDLVDVRVGGFGCGGLFRNNGTESNKNFVVDVLSVP